jgi:hypothetical protein
MESQRGGVMKRILVISDLHCGHRAGLTPPEFWFPENGHMARWGALQRETWRWFEDTIKRLQPVHGVVWCGDLIEGKGHRSGATELVTADRIAQTAMARAAVNATHSGLHHFVYGTPSHTGEDEDFEQLIRTAEEAGIEGHAYIDVDEVRIDAKHKVGGSTIPHGRYTAIAREKLWADLWELTGYIEKRTGPMFICRGHVHYCKMIQDYDDIRGPAIGMTLPTMSGPGSKYGIRQCSGVINMGLVELQIKGRDISCSVHQLFIRSTRPKIIKW